MPILKQGKYQLATGNQWMDRESTGFTKTIIKMPPGVALYKMKLGKAKLDIIPYVAGPGNPDAQPGFLTWKRTLWVHRNIGPNRDVVLCPAKMLNKPCPVCEDYNRQMRTNPDDEAYKQISELRPKEWDFMQVRDRNDPAKKIQFNITSYHRFSNEIAEAVSAGGPEQKFGNFWHPKGGQILNVSFGEKSMGRGGRPFILATRVDFSPRPDVPEQVIDKGFKLDSLLIFYKYEKLTEMHGASAAAEGEEAPAEGEEMPEAEEAQYDETTPEAAEGEEQPADGEEAPPDEGTEGYEEAPAEEGAEGEAEAGDYEEQPAEEEAPPPPPRRPAPKGKAPPKPAARRAAPPAEPEEQVTDWGAFDQQGGPTADGEEAPPEEESPDPEPEEEAAPAPPPRRPAPKPAPKAAARPTGKPAPKPAARPAARR
jgi:hypothetical protein